VVTVWYGKIDEHWTALGFIGSEAPLTVDAAQLERALPGSRAGAAAGPLLVRHACRGPLELRRRWPTPDSAAPPRLNTDEHPRVEFSTPITAWTKGSRLRFDTLRDFHEATLTKLEARGVSFSPSPQSPPLDMATVRAAHREALKELPD
jgi:hypothetical protein